MLKVIKTQLVSLISSLGYNITDSGFYEEKFPWLMLRTENNTFFDTNDTRQRTILFTLDIFSAYPGEAEIIDIVENIGTHLPALFADDSRVYSFKQRHCKILEDKAKGPSRKHGVVSYEFKVTEQLEEKQNDESTDDENEDSNS